jgi:hypothetical protein
MTIFQDKMADLPSVNQYYGSTIGGYSIHPIAATLIQQLAQDLLGVVRREGESADLPTFDRTYRDFSPWVQESIYRALINGSDHWLVLDHGDDQENWDTAAPANVPSPYQIYNSKPTIGLLRSGVSSADQREVDPSRYVRFQNPYPFNLGRFLNLELTQYDRLARGVSDRVLTGGSLMFGINGLWQKVLAGGQALANLSTRLRQTKDAIGNPGGVLAYDLIDEKPELVSKPYHSEHEATAIWEDRITAVTGIPAFVIWGKADGDQYSTATSLRLYSQRLGGMANRYLLPSLNLLAALISPNDDEPPYFSLVDLYPETLKDQAERLDQTVTALATLVGIGALSALEVRDTVASQFDIRLNPNTPIINNPNP